MPKRRKRSNQRIAKDRIIEIRRQIAERTKRVIVIISTCLIVICLILIFKVGEFIYPSWVIIHRTQIIGILILGLTLVILFSPLIIEVNSNTRTLSGPGKNPRLDLWN